MSAIYLKEASLTELLGEVARRFDEQAPVPAWAAPVIFAVATYYGLSSEHLRSQRRSEALTKPRHLAIALLAQLHPTRTRAEVCAVLGLEHHMYKFAISRIEGRVSQFPDFRSEVEDVLRIIRETTGEQGHCRASPRGMCPPPAAAAP